MVSLPLLPCVFTAKAALGEKKEALVSLYITASQFAWRCPSTGSWACKSCKLLQAAAVNNNSFLSHRAWFSKGWNSLSGVSEV